MLRAVKHRFGPTSELGLFEMTGSGLVDLADPSALFLADRRQGTSGSAVAAVLEGARPLLVEVQALTGRKEVQFPRRAVTGVDSGRLAMLLGVLEQRVGVPLATVEVYASVAGGVRIAEPGGDLAVCLAVVSAHFDRALPPDAVAVGEVGLGGEIRQAAQTPRRLAEAARLGFAQAVVPESTPDVEGIRLRRVSTLEQAVTEVLGP
jgi:DNA repair protein RadA/Sms